MDERDQLIVQKDAIIAEKDGAINTYLSTIASLTQQVAELCLVCSTEERNATESAPHSDVALDTLVANLTDSIVDPAVTPPRPASRQRLTSLLDNPASPSRTVQDFQLPRLLVLPLYCTWTANHGNGGIDCKCPSFYTRRGDGKASRGECKAERKTPNSPEQL